MRRASAKATGRWRTSGAGYNWKDKFLRCMNIQRAKFRVGDAPLDVASVLAAVAEPGHGAVSIFIGNVRDTNAGRQVLWLDYEAYTPLAVKSFERIAGEAGATWPDTVIAIHHRTGRVEIGEASVVIAAASPHRADAFSAARYAIERIKQIAPIWKHEHFAGGDVWIEGATADPHDEAARQVAFERACS